MSTHDIPLTDDLFQGHIELQREAGWVKPWRLPYGRRALFPSPDEALLGRAEAASGVRLRLATAATELTLRCRPLPDSAPAAGRPGFCFDATIDGELVQSVPVPPGGDEAQFTLPAGDKVVELWLSQEIPVALTGLEGDAPGGPAPDERPRWVTYGSSLTHCVRAHSPARTWPAVVARRRGLHLTSLGFGGQCHLDPMVGFVIADQPADYITLKLGINTVNAPTLSGRTYPAAIVGLVQIIRQKHPDTPMALVSPIGYPPRETDPNAAGYTISGMRRDMADVHRRLVELGDENLIYVDGLEVFSLDEIARYAEDQCHPDGDGIEVQAANFDRAVMARLLA